LNVNYYLPKNKTVNYFVHSIPCNQNRSETIIKT